jgi:pimeloyl-ACP methyl ester carboxylesterase
MSAEPQLIWETRFVPANSLQSRRAQDELGIAHTWGAGPEVIFLSNPLSDPVAWSDGVREELLSLGYQVTTFEHRPSGLDWQSVVSCVKEFALRRSEPVALVGWSQGAAIAQEVALAAGERVRVAVLLATYGRQNEIDKVLQESWDYLAQEGPDSLRIALRLLTAFPPDRLSDDGFVQRLGKQPGWTGKPDLLARRRAASFIATYQDRVASLARLWQPCLVMGFELDTDTFAARAREVADAVPSAEYVEIAGLGHAAPFSDPGLVWPPVLRFLEQHYPPQ